MYGAIGPGIGIGILARVGIIVLFQPVIRNAQEIVNPAGHVRRILEELFALQQQRQTGIYEHGNGDSAAKIDQFENLPPWQRPVDGAQVGQNTAMTLNPSSLGSTTNNYIGKSEYANPYLDGSIDEFRIYNVGLSAAEIAATLALGSTLALNAVGNFSDGTHQNIDVVATWTSSATNIATVNSQGTVTGVADGTVTITAQLGAVSSSASLTVEDLTSVTIVPASASFAALTSMQLAAIGALADGSTQDLTGSVVWTSSNAEAVTLSISRRSSGSTPPLPGPTRRPSSGKSWDRGSPGACPPRATSTREFSTSSPPTASSS